MRLASRCFNLKVLGRRLLPGGGMGLLVAGLLHLGVWQSLEHIAYNALFRLRGELPWDERVVLVAIDEASLKQLGQFPLPRQYYTQLLQQLTAADPAVVVLDLVFAEATPEDANLAAAIARQGRVVLAQAWDSYGQPLPPTPVLRQAAIASGHVLNRPDSDGVTRRVELEVQGISHLGVAALQVYSLVQGPIPRPDLQAEGWLNWVGAARTLRAYSLVDVIRGTVPTGAFRNKIVFVGMTVSGADTLVTPFDWTPPVSGVYLDATLLNNMLRQQLLRRLPPVGGLLLLVGLGALWSLGLSNQRSSYRWGLLLGGCLGWNGLALAALVHGYWLPVVAPMILLGLTTLALEGQERLQLNRQLRRDIQRLWQAHHQDLLVSPGAAEPEMTLPVPDPLQPTTQLAELAAQFARSQSAHAAIARNLSLGLLALDSQERIWFCNPLAMDWLQVQVGDRLSQRLVPDWWSLADWQQDWQHLTSGQRLSRELQRHDQWFEIKLEPLFYQPALQSAPLPAVPTGFLLLLENITPRKQVEGEMRRALEREKELNELKSRFVSMVSHELRTPLTTIQTSAELLEYYEWPAAKKQERFQQIHRSIQHMIQLIEDVLVIGKAEADSSQFQPRLVNLVNLCQTVLADLQTSVTPTGPIQFGVQGSVQMTWLDPSLLRQMLTNLVSNAVKYSPQGGEVRLDLEYQSDRVVLRVRDQGIGIPPEDVQHLFDHFHRAGNVGSIAGTGLGLAIVKRAVDLHQGEVTVESQVGVGTQFTVTLPYHLG